MNKKALNEVLKYIAVSTVISILTLWTYLFINQKEIMTCDFVAQDKLVTMKTNKWTIKIKLFNDKVPVTANNFMALASTWYYDGVTFHRVIKDFMIQWGDPSWTWAWGESIYGEAFIDEFDNELSNKRWFISMANSWPKTNWSQFFIIQRDSEYLDGKHSVFGEICSGIEVVDTIAKQKTQNDKPLKEIKIISTKVEEYVVPEWKEDGSFKDYEVDVESIKKEYKDLLEKKAEEKKTREIKAWDKVSVHYIWTLEDWEEFDNSYKRWNPLEFMALSGQMIKWFDNAVEWMKIWEKKSITLSPEEAYWEYDENNIAKMDISAFEWSWIELKVWGDVPTQQGVFKIKEVDEENGEVVLDVNSPLAWKTLNFDIEIIDIN